MKTSLNQNVPPEEVAFRVVVHELLHGLNAGHTAEPAATNGFSPTLNSSIMRAVASADGSRDTILAETRSTVSAWIAQVGGATINGLVCMPWSDGSSAPGLPEFEARGDFIDSKTFPAYEQSFRGGVLVAIGKVNSDGRQKILAGSGIGGGPRVRVFDALTGNSEGDFYAYDQNFRDGVGVAVGRLWANQLPSILTAPGVGGGPHFKAFTASGTEQNSRFVLDPNLRTGLSIGVGDLRGDGRRVIVAGPRGSGVPSIIQMLDVQTNQVLAQFEPFPGFSGGISLAIADFNRDGKEDIVVAPGYGGGSFFKILDGPAAMASRATEIFSKDLYPGFIGGTSVSAGDLNGDNVPDVLVGTGPGMPARISAWSVANGSVELLARLNPYDDSFRGGINVAAGKGIIVVGTGLGGGPVVKTYEHKALASFPNNGNAYVPTPTNTPTATATATPTTTLAPGEPTRTPAPPTATPTIVPTATPTFTATPVRAVNLVNVGTHTVYDPNLRSGVLVATGDVDGDGRVDVVTGPGEGGGPHVRAFDALTAASKASFYSFEPSLMNGTGVSTGDVNNDGVSEIYASAGPGGGPHAKIFTASGQQLWSSYVLPQQCAVGVSIVTADLNADGRKEIISAPRDAGPQSIIRIMDGATGAVRADVAPYGGFSGGLSLAVADIDRDGIFDIIIGPGRTGGSHVHVYSGAYAYHGQLITLAAYWVIPQSAGFTGGINVAAADLNQDGYAEIIAGTGPGIQSQIFVISTKNMVFQTVQTRTVFPGFTGGARVAASGRVVVAGAGPGGSPTLEVWYAS